MSYIEIIKSKIFTADGLVKQMEVWAVRKEKVVFTNGCFDLLHRGHVDYLCAARDCGDKLIVAVNSDASVKKLNKGGSRPLQDQDSRALIIAALHFVDAVVIFDEDTPYELIKKVKPHVLVKGADYKVEEVAGHDIVLKAGGEVKLIPLTEGYSTTGIEKKIKGG